MEIYFEYECEVCKEILLIKSNKIIINHLQVNQMSDKIGNVCQGRLIKIFKNKEGV